MDKRYIDNQLWLGEITEIVKSGEELSLNITGSSMLPFLKGGRDRVLLSLFTPPARTGDILLYQRKSGEYVLHRVVKISEYGLYFAGDIQSVIEGPVSQSDIKAIVTAAERNGKWIEIGSPEWDFYKDKWIKTLPYRKYFSRLFYFSRKAENKLKK